MEHSFIFYQ